MEEDLKQVGVKRCREKDKNKHYRVFVLREARAKSERVIELMKKNLKGNGKEHKKEENMEAY